MHRKIIKPYLLSILILITCIGLFFVNLQLAANFQFQDKFAARWMAVNTWLKDGTSPYDELVQEATNSLLQDRNYLNPQTMDLRFYEPVFYLIPYIPFGFIAYETARSIWLLILEASICGIIILGIRISGWKIRPLATAIFVIGGLFSYPSIKVLLTADPAGLYIFLVLLACWLAMNNHGTAAGFLLAFTLGVIEIGFIVAAFLIFWRLTKRDSSILLSFLSGLVFGILISWILFPGWFDNWFGVLIELFPDANAFRTPLMRISALFPGAISPLNYILHIGIILILLLEWFDAFRKTGRVVAWKTSLTLSLVYFLQVQSQVSYLLLLAPAYFMILRFLSDRWKMFGKILSWLLTALLISVYWYISANKNSWQTAETSLILLLVPVIVIAGLNWIRWWALQKPDPLLQ